jgi:cyclopropane fatty-acyl-phospholipid synthase-like methyltransferase
MADRIDLYNPAYSHFSTKVLEQVRYETYREDTGQNSWLTADELRKYIKMLSLNKESHVLEVACGSGGSALFIAKTTGCRIWGIDINEKGIINANKLAIAEGLDGQVEFRHSDANQKLPFEDQSFDAIICIDSINHLQNRMKVLIDWHRLLKSNGRLLFTDPIVVSGILSNEEIAIRSSIGYFLFVPLGENERLIKQAGLELLSMLDFTENAAEVLKRWMNSRSSHKNELLKIEDQKTFDGLQRFLNVVHNLYSEKRLSRIVFLAGKTD